MQADNDESATANRQQLRDIRVGVCLEGGQGSYREKGYRSVQERRTEMAQCEVCGNEYDKALGISDTQAPPMLTVSLTT